MMAFPAPKRKNLALNNTFYCTHVGCNPSARPYHYYYVRCPDRVWRYVHAGTDVHGYEGDLLVAEYSGTIEWVNEGPSFGLHQFCIVDSLGRGFHYKHTRTRPKDGLKVVKAEPVAQMGNESFYIDRYGKLRSYNIAPHLHNGLYTKWNDRRTVVNLYPALKAAKAA